MRSHHIKSDHPSTSFKPILGIINQSGKLQKSWKNTIFCFLETHWVRNKKEHISVMSHPWLMSLSNLENIKKLWIKMVDDYFLVYIKSCNATKHWTAFAILWSIITIIITQIFKKTHLCSVICCQDSILHNSSLQRCVFSSNETWPGVCRWLNLPWHLDKELWRT